MMMKKLYKSLIFVCLAVMLSCSEEAEEVTGDDQEPPPETAIHVPADHATIQAAIDAADDGDSVVVADGIYKGEGNRDIQFRGKSITLVSENGPGATIIDCEGTVDALHIGFNFSSTDESGTVIDGFTVRNGYSAQGSGVLLKSASPTIKNCVFINNIGTVSGGAVRLKASSARFVNCTFVRSSAPVGAAVLMIATSRPEFENCIIASSTGGEVVTCSDTYSGATFTCSDLFGNEGGNWVGCLTDQANDNGNMSMDPMFCDPDAGDFGLQGDSPCVGA
ncbi:MAG: hypothetical protein JSW34_07070, partial [Candidatus Zixiibacteriota bacterium]